MGGVQNNQSNYFFRNGLIISNPIVNLGTFEEKSEIEKRENKK